MVEQKLSHEIRSMMSRIRQKVFAYHSGTADHLAEQSAAKAVEAIPGEEKPEDLEDSEDLENSGADFAPEDLLAAPLSDDEAQDMVENQSPDQLFESDFDRDFDRDFDPDKDEIADHGLEQQVIAQLQPMVHAWLDTHVPQIVQSIIEREIRRD